MIFVLANWLFNGLLLSWIYILGFVLLPKGHMHYNPPLWIFYVSGYVTVGLLTFIGISKVGHFLLRMFIGARYAVARERQQIEPILNEVLGKVNANLGTNYQLDKLHIMVNDSKEPNAQAFGRDTIVVTDGLLKLCTNDELQGVLAHEMGHLYYRDSVTLVAILFSSIVTRVVMWLYAIYCFIVASILKTGEEITAFYGLLAAIPALIFLPVIIVHWVGSWLLKLTLLFMGRQYEYRADKFAKDLGYQLGLISFLEKVQSITEHDNSMLGKIFNTHPAPMKRVGKLEK